MFARRYGHRSGRSRARASARASPKVLAQVAARDTGAAPIKSGASGNDRQTQTDSHGAYVRLNQVSTGSRRAVLRECVYTR